MNWLITENSKFTFHTSLQQVLAPLQAEIQRYDWLVSDLELNTAQLEKLPVDREQDYFLLTPAEMEIMLALDPQVIWGVFSAIDPHISPQLTLDQLPFADGNAQVWENEKLQLEGAKIEIIAWDGSCTIVKFGEKGLSEKFRRYFEEARALGNV